jgi:lysophospholipase L1-like esterase
LVLRNRVILTYLRLMINGGICVDYGFDMMEAMQFILILLTVVVVGYAALLGPRVMRFIRISREVKRTTKPFTAVSDQHKKHLAILGDSSMYSAGATQPHLTIGGLMAADYPNASVETLAVNGAQVKDLPSQLANLQFERYEFVLVGVGGNDVVRFENFSNVERQLSEFLASASKVTDKIVLCHSVNIGNIGFFPFPINRIFDRRTRQLSEMYERLAEQHKNVTYVNFYRPLHDDYYTKHTRAQFLAADGFHASDYANKYFYELIQKALPK